MFIFKKKPWQIHVPAAAVIHEWQALFIISECTIYLDRKQKMQLLFVNNIINAIIYIYCLYYIILIENNIIE